MFLNTNNLNEGGCRDRCSGDRKRELYEGKNPKATNHWHGTKNSAYANVNWQSLRR
ncbi:MAG: hypothetical protein ABFS16_06805 [Bacteroidota bacterium]